jgi:hypothetical protein
MAWGGGVTIACPNPRSATNKTTELSYGDYSTPTVRIKWHRSSHLKRVLQVSPAKVTLRQIRSAMADRVVAHEVRPSYK